MMKLLSCHSIMRLKVLSEILIFQWTNNRSKCDIQSIRKNYIVCQEKHLKPVKTKLNHYKHKNTPWITMGIINSIKFSDKMYKRLRLTNCDSPMYETLEKNLKNYNCILQRNINAAKKNYCESKFNRRYLSNIKQTWTTINLDHH